MASLLGDSLRDMRGSTSCDNILLSPTNTRLQRPSWSSETNSTSLREASFSSYLDTSEETYIRSLVNNHNPLHNNNPNPKKVEDGEIDVFRADKYFNSGLTGERSSSTRSKSAKYQTSDQHSEDHSDQRVRVSSNKLKVQPQTPSSQSEMSSNSQNALLRRFHRTPSKSSTNEGNKVQGKMSLLQSCSCCARKSVDIEKDFINYGTRGFSRGIPRSIKTNLDTAEITRINKLRVDHSDPFVFPVSTSITAIDVEEQVEPRKSLDVFGSSELDDGSKRFSLQKRLNMLSWDAIPRSTEETNTSGAPSETYKDTESDASSDLFEIECLSCTADPVIQGPRVPSSDGSATPTTGYAPSEASIDWSVVTASAADFSTTSDFEDQRSIAVHSATRHKMAPKATSSSRMSLSKEVQKPISSILLGCKSQKAVNVAREVHRKTPPREKSDRQRLHRFSDSFTHVTRFQAEAKLANFSHRQRQSLSPDLLYIQ